MVDPGYGNLGARVFFVWGSLCATCCVFAYAFVPETKGLTLEQVDKMMEEVPPHKSAAWRPHDTFAHGFRMDDKLDRDVADTPYTEQTELTKDDVMKA